MPQARIGARISYGPGLPPDESGISLIQFNVADPRAAIVTPDAGLPNRSVTVAARFVVKAD